MRVLKLLLERLGADFSLPGGLAAVAGPALMLVGWWVLRTALGGCLWVVRCGRGRVHACTACRRVGLPALCGHTSSAYGSVTPPMHASLCPLSVPPPCPACQVGDAAGHPELREMRPSTLAAAALLACRRSAGEEGCRCRRRWGAA